LTRLHVLHHASEEQIFGLGMMKELARHGYAIGPGTLCPLLHRLEEGGSLVSRAEVVGGKTRKHYEVPAKGRPVLQKIARKTVELADEVLPHAQVGTHHLPARGRRSG
jgi:DNA-binding PadR family transcriptional regulator